MATHNLTCQACDRDFSAYRSDSRFCSARCRKRDSRRRNRDISDVTVTSGTVPKVVGRREPTYRMVPEASSSAGEEAIGLGERIGVTLDGFQEDILEDAMGRDSDGAWAADEVVGVLPRQNGKTVVAVLRALWGALEGGERLVLFTAHEFKTCREAFLLLRQWVEHPALSSFEPKVSTSHGKEGVTFSNGARILFIARSRTSGRGFSPDLVILDESFELDDLALAALKPALSAGSSKQMWFLSSAPHDTSTVLRRLCLKGREGSAERMVYLEWCADDDAASGDVSALLQANPAVGTRLTLEYSVSELEAMSDEDYRRERLGIWSADVSSEFVFAPAVWEALRAETRVLPVGARALAIDVAPDRRRTAIGAAADVGAGRVLVEVVADRDGVGWVVDEVAALVAAHSPDVVLVDGAGQSQTLIAPLEKAGVEVTRVGPGEMVAACGSFHDAVIEGTLTHLGQDELTTAVEGAKQRNLGDAWAWGRRTSRVNVAPLVACTLALWAVSTHEPESEPGIQII